VPVEADNPRAPEYVAKTVSVPAGAADDVQEPAPLDSVAVHSDVEPVENVTDPVGVGNPPVVVETDAE
jgi:hypothetical protein